MLKPLADRHELMADRSEHYAPAAAQRSTTSSAVCSSPAPAATSSPAGQVRLLEADGGAPSRGSSPPRCWS